MPEARRDAAVALWSAGAGDDYLAVFGGLTANGTYLRDTWLFSLTKQLWSSVAVNVSKRGGGGVGVGWGWGGGALRPPTVARPCSVTRAAHLPACGLRSTVL